MARTHSGLFINWPCGGQLGAAEIHGQCGSTADDKHLKASHAFAIISLYRCVNDLPHLYIVAPHMMTTGTLVSIMHLPLSSYMFVCMIASNI